MSYTKHKNVYLFTHRNKFQLALCFAYEKSHFQGIQIRKRELIKLFSFITSHCFDAGITEGGNTIYATS
jgi:hypothetical protein